MSRRWFAGSATPPVLVHLPRKQLLYVGNSLCPSHLALFAHPVGISVHKLQKSGGAGINLDVSPWKGFLKDILPLFDTLPVKRQTTLVYSFFATKKLTYFSFRKWTTDFKLGPISKS